MHDSFLPIENATCHRRCCFKAEEYFPNIVLFISYSFQRAEHSSGINISSYRPHLSWFNASPIQLVSAVFFRESLHLIAGWSLFLLPILGVHSVILFTRSSFFIADIFPAHLNFLMPASATKSSTFAAPRYHSPAFLSSTLVPLLCAGGIPHFLGCCIHLRAAENC